MQRPLTLQLLDEIQDGFNRQDVAGILSHFTDDCIWLMARGPDAPEGRRCTGKAEIGEVLRARYQAIPDMRWEEMRHWICVFKICIWTSSEERVPDKSMASGFS